MNKIICWIILLGNLCVKPAIAQQPSSSASVTKVYNETPARINDLINTKLDVKFDYKKRYLYGKEWLTLKPHFYATDSLRLDAKGMDISTIAMVKKGKNIPLQFTYDSLTINIVLDKTYRNTETYTIYIEYTAKPNELKNINKDERGLYFINPDGTEDKPIQIWTQGEPENASTWFVTIDKPNQKTTSEIAMTVPSKYVTLSNGVLFSQRKNGDGSRTDTWKMALPHSPYLFMMAVGDFTIYKDSWKGKEVSYYLEPKYAPYAKDIFGITPEAIDFFSKTLGAEFPWSKYAQIIVRDYVSGAMENTTAAIFGESMQGNKRDLADQYNQTGIVHELFHQWFGDYVTAESWSNLTLNESFADLAEIIWLEHKYGKDAAEEHIAKGLQGYLNNPDAATKNLVRYNYKDKQEVFDGVTYQKGGRILNMLRNYLGDAAFYKGLHIYLQTNAFKNAEAQQLRLAFEEASGADLNWFFDQWYFGAGHPVLNISYKWDAATKIQTVYLQQTQQGATFILPMAVDIYLDGKKERHQIWMRSKADTFLFQAASKPLLVNVDADKVLISKKSDNKSMEEYFFQYNKAPLFADRNEAIDAAIEKLDEMTGQNIIVKALTDKYFGLRIKAINSLNISNPTLIKAALSVINELLQKEENNLVRAAAITFLGKLKDPDNMDLFKRSLKCDSYSVQGAALQAIALIDTAKALAFAKLFEQDNKGPLSETILKLYTSNGNNAQWSYIYSLYQHLIPPKRFNIIQPFAELTGRVENTAYAAQGIAAIKELGVKYKQFGIAPKIIEVLNEIKQHRIQSGDTNSASDIETAIIQINDAR